MQCYEELNVSSYINRIGMEVQEKWKEIAHKNNVGISVSGIYPLSHFEFAYNNTLALKTYFTQEMLKEGFLASNSFYMSFAHNDVMLDKYFEAFDKVTQKINRILVQKENVLDYITKVCQSGFERLN